MTDSSHSSFSPPPSYNSSAEEPVPFYTNSLVGVPLYNSLYSIDTSTSYQRDNNINRLLSYFKPYSVLKLYEANSATTPTYQLNDTNMYPLITALFEQNKTVYLNNKCDLVCQGERVYPSYIKKTFELNLLPANQPTQLYEITMVNLTRFFVTTDSKNPKIFFFTFDGNACKITRITDHAKVGSFKVSRTETKLGSLLFSSHLSKSDMLALTLAFLYIKKTIHTLKSDGGKKRVKSK